jgi:hypothetical protein
MSSDVRFRPCQSWNRAKGCWRQSKIMPRQIGEHWPTSRDECVNLVERSLKGTLTEYLACATSVRCCPVPTSHNPERYTQVVGCKSLHQNRFGGHHAEAA